MTPAVKYVYQEHGYEDDFDLTLVYACAIIEETQNQQWAGEVDYQETLKTAAETYRRKHARHGKPLTQAAVAGKLGMSKARFWQILNDKDRPPKQIDLQKLAKLLGLDYQQLEEAVSVVRKPHRHRRRVTPPDISSWGLRREAAEELHRLFPGFAAALASYGVSAENAYLALQSSLKLLVDEDDASRRDSLERLARLGRVDAPPGQRRREKSDSVRAEDATISDPRDDIPWTIEEPAYRPRTQAEILNVPDNSTEAKIIDIVTTRLRSPVLIVSGFAIVREQRRIERELYLDRSRWLMRKPKPAELYAALLDKELIRKISADIDVDRAGQDVGFDPSQSGSEMNFWRAFMKESRPGVVCRTALEIKRRGLSLKTFYTAYCMSLVDNIQGNFDFIDAIVIQWRLRDWSNEPDELRTAERQAALEKRLAHHARMFGRCVAVDEKESCQDVIIAVGKLTDPQQKYERFAAACKALPDYSELMAEFAGWLTATASDLGNRDASLAEAADLLNKAKGINKECPTVYYATGLLNLERGNLETAAVALEEAIRLDPYVSAYYWQLANVYRSMKELGAANRVWRMAIRAIPEDDSLWRTAQTDLVHAGSYKYACRVGHTAANLFPKNVWVKYNYACGISRRHFSKSAEKLPKRYWVLIASLLRDVMALARTAQLDLRAIIDHLHRDFDFLQLRGEPEFEELVRSFRDQEQLTAAAPAATAAASTPEMEPGELVGTA